MKKIHIIGVLCLCAIAFQNISTVNASLVGRLPVTPSGTNYQAVYDTDQDLTWIPIR